jgi:hypothetical protein
VSGRTAVTAYTPKFAIVSIAAFTSPAAVTPVCPFAARTSVSTFTLEFHGTVDGADGEQE